MNSNEEELLHWWCERIVAIRDYDILLRNLTASGIEFDGVGVKLGVDKSNREPIIENIEAKYANAAKAISRQRRKLQDQITRRKSFGGFNGLIGVSNEREVLRGLPGDIGAIHVQSKSQTQFPAECFYRPPSAVCVSAGARLSVLHAVRQVYSTAAVIGFPCIFVKCKNVDCRYYYGYSARVPLPMSFDGRGHSHYCPLSDDFRNNRPYLYLNRGFAINGTPYFVTRINRPL